MVLLLCFCFHFANGIRHLLWDAGIGLERKAARFSAKLVACWRRWPPSRLLVAVLPAWSHAMSDAAQALSKVLGPRLGA